MRFCHVTTYYPPFNFGGDGIAVQMVCEALARQGHHVDVVHCADAYELRGHHATTLPDDPCGVRRFTLRSRLGALSPLVTQQSGRPGLKHEQLRKILSNEYDVVHFHNISLVGGPGILPLSQAQVTLYTTHDHWLLCPTHVYWKNRSRPCDRPTCFMCQLMSGIPPQLWRHTDLLRRCLRHVDAILCPSEFTARRHREAGIDRPIHVHRWFPRVEFSPSAERDIRESGPEEIPRFVYAGRQVTSKGVEHLLETFARRPQYRLDVAGEGPLQESLTRRFSSCPHIRLVGSLHFPELLRLFRGARAVILPSWGPEAGPLAPLEALACGTPVIVRRAGGSAEAVEMSGGGLVYDHPEELLPLVDQIAEDAKLWHTLSEQAVRGSREQFGEQQWMSQYFGIIERIGRAKAAGRCTGRNHP